MAATAKTPQRSPDRIAAEIAGERAQLGRAFDTLRDDVSAAGHSDNQTIAAARGALLLAPAMAVAVAAVAGGLVAGARAIGRQRSQG
jgi:hypothetical protein